MSNRNIRQEAYTDGYEYEDDEIQIDWAGIFKKVWSKKWLYIASIPITVIIAYLLVSSIPKTYRVQVKLAPEFSTMSARTTSSSLNTLMRSFGIGTSTSSTGDAILPTLYPELINSKAFLVSLFDIPVESKDGEIKTDYYDYIANYQKRPWWSAAKSWVLGLVFGNKEVEDNYKEADAAALTSKQARIASAISKKVVCNLDEKYGILSIIVLDQDPQICATVANSTCERLQQFITDYRTKKAQQELMDIQRQYDQARAEYDQAKAVVEQYNNSHWDLVEEDYKVEKQALQNEMQLKFTTLSAFNTQLADARSKYESMRPVYTVLDGASVPTKAASPSKKKFILGLLFLVFLAETVYVLRDNIKDMFN